MYKVRYQFTNTPVRQRIPLTGDDAGFNSITLESLIGKYSFYNINSNTNTITWIEGVTTLSTTLTEGNYDSTSIIVAIKSAMDAESIVSGASLTYTLTSNIVSSKITVAVSAGNLQITPIGVDAFYLCGFHTDSALSTSVTSDMTFNFTSDYIDIRIYNGSQIFFINSVEQNYFSLQVPIIGIYGSIMYFMNIGQKTLVYSVPGQVNWNQISVDVYDSFGNRIDNNGQKLNIDFVLT